MKKVIALLTGFFALSGILFAQSEDKTGMEWVLSDDLEKVQFDQNYYYGGGIGYGYAPFDDYIGMSLNGSRYRKAKSNKLAGITLVSLTPTALPFLGWVAREGTWFSASLVAAATAGCLVGGIYLWQKGNKELDWMLDDYVRRYGPKPYSSSLSVGPTQNGIGLAFNF